MKKPTIRDIAKEAEVSPASVSMILNGKSLSRFSQETVSRVYETSRRLGYKPRRQEKGGRRKAILIICPSLTNPYYASLVQGMEQEAKIQGYTTIIYTTYWDKAEERAALELCADPRIAGVIFSMIPQQRSLAEEAARSIPMAAVGDRNTNLAIDTIDVCNYQAGCIAASHLIRLGHRHIAYISTGLSSEHSSRVNRLSGLEDEYRRSCPEGSVIVYTRDVPAEQELNVVEIEHTVGYALAQECMKNSPEVTAIAAINDMVAYGVRDALLDAGMRIPEDISLCGFDNIYPSGFHGIDLTTVEHSIVERGRSSVRLLAEKLRGESELLMDANSITRVEYPSQLVIRGSTGRPPSTGRTHTETDRS